MGKFAEVLKAIGVVAAHVAEQAATDPKVEQALAQLVASALAAHTGK